MEETKALTIKIPANSSLDEYFAHACLNQTMKQVVNVRNTAANARMFLVCDMICNAVYDMDIGLVETIVRRVDGSVPERDKRDSFANMFGDALDDVLDMPMDDRLQVRTDDIPIVALAKVCVAIACNPNVGKNPNERKDRQKAADIILQRTGGRVVEPVRIEAKTAFAEPSWLSQLPSGEH